MTIRKIFLAFILLLLCVPAVADTPFQTPMRFDTMQKIPVLHDGRVKPFGRAAQITIQRINGTLLPLRDATALITHIMFDPSSAQTPKLFYIHDDTLRLLLELPESKTPYYSFKDVSEAFAKQSERIASLRAAPPSSLTDAQNAFLDMYGNVVFFEQIIGSMTLALPLKGYDGALIDVIQSGQDTTIKALLDKGTYMQEWRIIPSGNTYVSPWQAFLSKTDTHALDIVTLWRHAADAYIAYDADQWNTAVHALYDKTTSTDLRFKLDTEILYLQLDPDFISLCFYSLAALLSLCALRYAHKGLFMPMAWSMALIAWGMHASSLAMRMIILQRPPVSDLYESFLFVGFLTVTFALFVTFRQTDIKRRKTILLLTTVLAAALHLFARTIHPEFDSFKVLQAVLDTKFWLATHVVLITAGYACALLTSVLAHAYIVTRRWFPSPQGIRHDVLYKRTYASALIALFLMVSGTVLGGIWADQSWGRFWGWDPKENGALLIILWLIWLLHGRVSRHISAHALMLGCAALSLLVAVSWIGTNLLGVGLHAYGFIDSVATALLVMIAVETAFLAYVGITDRTHKGEHDA